jgi:hypothetical protein
MLENANNKQSSEDEFELMKYRMIAREIKTVNHSADIIGLLNKTYELTKANNMQRQLNHIMLQLGQEYYSVNDYSTSKK